jgi:hypothetical protein
MGYHIRSAEGYVKRMSATDLSGRAPAPGAPFHLMWQNATAAEFSLLMTLCLLPPFPDAFSKFGTVVESRVVPTGRIRPFAFVTFESESDAASAMAAMQGQTLTTQPLTVEYSTLGSKKERKPKEAKQPRPAKEEKGETKGEAAPKPKKERQPKKEKAAPAAGGDAAASAASPNGGDAAGSPASPGEGGDKKKKRTRRPRKEKGEAASPSADAAAPAEKAE